MDRLLSEQEICKICGSECEGTIAENCDWRDDPHGECHKLLAAQLSKTDKEWVEWVEQHIITSKDALFYGCMIIHPSEWQSRRKEVGL